MDYPQLNLLFGLALILTLVINVSLRVLLFKAPLPDWQSFVSWLALILSIVSALYIESLFLRLMTSAFNRQIGTGLLVIGGIDALVTASLYRRIDFGRLGSALVAVQVLVCLASLMIALILYRSLVPIF